MTNGVKSTFKILQTLLDAKEIEIDKVVIKVLIKITLAWVKVNVDND